MNTRPSLYRSTLIAAAVAIGCFGAATAQAHEHGWRGHDEDRAWHGHERGWHDRDRGWYDHDGDRGWRRAYFPGYAYAVPGWRADWDGYVPAYPPPPAYVPGGVSVVVRLPL